MPENIVSNKGVRFWGSYERFCGDQYSNTADGTGTKDKGCEVKMEIHICPILMRTGRFEERQCAEQCDETDCPVMIEIQRQEENK